jgi:hypothetical protein
LRYGGGVELIFSGLSYVLVLLVDAYGRGKEGRLEKVVA